MHHIYQTDGFILGSVPRGEANRYLYIFTRDLGMIQASAQAVRLINSKLRYSLQDYSLSHLSLVRGKDIWRITSASKIFGLNNELDSSSFNLIARVFSLLRRLLTGEEANQNLFKIILAAVSFLRENKLTEENLANFEYILVLRILNTLGYLGENSIFTPFLSTEIWHQQLLENMQTISREAIFTINNSLKESHL